MQRKTKTETLTLRITPEIKEAAAKIAQRQRRSVVSLIEYLVQQEAERVGVPLDQAA